MPDNFRSPIRLQPVVILVFLLTVLWPAYIRANEKERDTLTGTSPDTIKLGETEAYVKGLFNKIEEKGHFVDALSGQDIGSLPVGLVREINGKVYVIAIDSARMTPKGAYFSAYFRFTFPGTQSELIFGGKDILFTPGGMGADASTKLVLLNDKTLKINEHLDLKFPGNGSNYIEWTCNGFKAANLSGVFEFDKGWLQPEDSTKETLTAALQVNVHDLSNIMASINMPTFRISGLKDFSFTVKNAVVDMSDIANPADLKVTPDMLEDAGDPLLWRGFYLKEIAVGLPSQFANKKDRPSVSVSDFYIDDQGISGKVTAENIVKLGDASAGGWPVSIEKIGLSFSKNKLNGGELGGQMEIGFLGDEPVDYNASVSMRGGDTYYAFGLKTNADKKYAFFAGNITISEGSRLDVAKTDKEFVASVTLHGKVDLNKSVLNVKDIAFQDLKISTQKPYVHSGTFDINTSGDSKMSNFPVQFDDIQIGLSEGKVAIGAKVRLSFMNASDKGFGAATSFVVTALQKEDSSHNTHWGLDKVKINDIELDVKVMAFKMHGVLTLFDDHPVYGNGFRGRLDFSMPGPIPKAIATAYFGTKDDYKYWHVDVYIGVTIPIPPMLKITGLMGGMSYHMERPSNFDPYDSRNALDEKGGMKDVSEIFQYVPVKEAGLGFMGGVSLALSADVVLNANVALEVQFGTDGGLRYVQFDGAGYVMHQALKAKSKNEAKEDESAPVWVQFKMRYDNINNTFDANIKTYVNILGVIRGIHERGLVGESALHIGPDDWWLYIGRPSFMNGLSVAGLAEIKTYFMMGSKVEDMPPLPTEVTEVFDQVNTNFMAMENSMSTGAGFGFGAHFKTSFSFDFGVYGDFAVGAGADILLRNYGDNTRCKGSNSVIGFNGWYAAGQAYVYLKGDVGIRVKVFAKKRSFSIAKLSAAVLLQAKLPNPSWFRGMVGVKYSILGGLVKGNANIKVELGTQCELVGAKELDIQVISAIKPDDNESEVSVFSTPQVAFNMPVAKPFAMLNNFDEVETYRIQLDGINVVKDGQSLIGTVQVSTDGISATFNQKDVLPPLSRLTATAKVHIERQSGASWEPLKDSSGTTSYETKSSSFNTADAPKYIPWENIAYTYPVKSQYNFLPREYNKGYIKLKMGQPYLFKAVDDAGAKWKIEAAFNPKQGAPLTTNVSYDEGMAQVNFDIPANLSREAIYTYRIMRSSLDGQDAANNVTSKQTTTVDETGETTVTQNALKDNAASGISKEVVAINFRTSRYGTFVEKMNAATDPRDLFDVATNYVSVIGQRFDAQETFDKYEIEGDASLTTKPLIALKASLNNSWLRDEIMPLLYNGYPFAAGIDITRDPALNIGIPPLEAVRLYNNDEAPYKLEDGQVNDGMALTRPGRCRFMYYVSFVAHDDYIEMRNKANRYYANAGSAPARVAPLLLSLYPDLRGNQYYPVELQYRLPGSNNISSTVTRSIYYKL